MTRKQFSLRGGMLESHPLVEETRNQLAVKRGPIVYCLESPDLPSEVRVRDVAVSSLDDFKVVRDFALLGGVAVLEAELHSTDASDWTNKLYRPVRRRPANENDAEPNAQSNHRITTRLVPYFAWSNRGESEMSVWLPRM